MGRMESKAETLILRCFVKSVESEAYNFVHFILFLLEI
jgi:hypothetical protein